MPSAHGNCTLHRERVKESRPSDAMRLEVPSAHGNCRLHRERVKEGSPSDAMRHEVLSEGERQAA